VYSRYLTKFPDGYNPSSQQIDLIKRIEDAYAKGYKYVICSAPTGSGKSFISKTLGNVSNKCSDEFRRLITSYDAFKQDYAGNHTHEVDCIKEPNHGTFALTITRSLQDQYHKLFEDSSTLKGKSNYQCEVNTDVDVENAPCLLLPKLKEECWSVNKCPYYNARNRALTDQFSILNYKMFLTLPGHVKRKNFIVCDEASELEDELVKHFSVFVEPEKFKLLGVKIPLLYSEEMQHVRTWLTALMVTLGEHIDALTHKHNNKNTTLNINDKIKLNYFKNFHRTLNLIDDTWGECEYVIQREKSTVRITPLRVDALSKYIFDYAENVLLMSATIVDHKNFAKSLGIDQYKYIEVDSTFDSKKAPIYVSNVGRLNKQNIEKNMPKIAKLIKDICESHSTEKGIIHTHTLDITKHIQKHLKGDRYLFRDSESKNDSILSKHSKSKEPTVIVSPSMTFGIDLKDDLARFQIIVKAAYLPLGDNRIKRLFDVDKDWYTDKMLISLVQACGRGIRSKDDHCTTYIIDQAITDAVIANRAKLPKYFVERFA
jgi:ATP-dependent DNA helicase DinG